MRFENKERVVAWLYPELIDRMEMLMQSHDMRNHTEFIEQAVDFYIGYLCTKNSTDFLSKVLMGAIESTMRETGNKQASNMFRLAVEVSMLMNLIAYELDMSDEDIKKLRGKCVRDVKQNRGRISFEDAVHYQNGIDFEDEKCQE